MNSSRTVIIIASLTMLTLAMGLTLLYSRYDISQTIDNMVEQKIADYTVSEQAVREHNDIHTKLKRINNVLETLQQMQTAGAQYNSDLAERVFVLEKNQTVPSTSQATVTLPQGGTSNEAMAELPSPDVSEDTKQAAHFQNLENNFQSGEVDSQFTLDLTDKLEESLEQVRRETATDASILSMECKNNLCRVEVAFENGLAANFMQLAIAQNTGNMITDGSTQHMRDSNGKLTSTVYYLARKGHSVTGDITDDSLLQPQ